jgi:hypothetical protein
VVGGSIPEGRVMAQEPLGPLEMMCSRKQQRRREVERGLVEQQGLGLQIPARERIAEM